MCHRADKDKSGIWQIAKYNNYFTLQWINVFTLHIYIYNIYMNTTYTRIMYIFKVNKIFFSLKKLKLRSKSPPHTSPPFRSLKRGTPPWISCLFPHGVQRPSHLLVKWQLHRGGTSPAVASLSSPCLCWLWILEVGGGRLGVVPVFVPVIIITRRC